jgi:hypothetical protein
MLSYHIDGPFVIMVATGETTSEERDAVFNGIRDDPKVEFGSHLIVDVRHSEARLTPMEFLSRAKAILEAMGPKIGSACAFVVNFESSHIGFEFQSAASKINFKVGVFHDERNARRWLMPFIASARRS